jgi:L-fuconolactonase
MLHGEAISGRIDAHHHVWRLARGDYGWLQPTEALAPICRDFDLEELRPLLAAEKIGASVLVQAAPTKAETRFLLDIARKSEGLVQGVVGWTDLAARDAVESLAALTGKGLLKGVRPMLQDLADPDWIARADVGRALAALPQLGLRLDALVRPRNLPALMRTLERHPDLAVVVDHCAKPDVAGAGWQPWADDLRRIARDTSAYCKLSGLVTEAGAKWTKDSLRPYVDHVLECFGAERLMWGSDWPVLSLAADYSTWSKTADALIAEASRHEQDAIRGGNARRFYGL